MARCSRKAAYRCLIPISAFAEAVGPPGEMTRAWISIADQPLAACAGLWRPTDEWGDSYTMVMVDAVPEMLETRSDARDTAPSRS